MGFRRSNSRVDDERRIFAEHRLIARTRLVRAIASTHLLLERPGVRLPLPGYENAKCEFPSFGKFRWDLVNRPTGRRVFRFGYVIGQGCNVESRHWARISRPALKRRFGVAACVLISTPVKSNARTFVKRTCRASSSRLYPSHFGTTTLRTANRVLVSVRRALFDTRRTASNNDMSPAEGQARTCN